MESAGREKKKKKQVAQIVELTKSLKQRCAWQGVYSR